MRGRDEEEEGRDEEEEGRDEEEVKGGGRKRRVIGTNSSTDLLFI